ncbi:hypothetical protein SO802_001998 [Lithocarpus litseifolius]|uniref:Zinc finger GRF-type domain-containing protein n=1 Tax=Lithocarpus litseifolius TaxID=425828 RepID=A0AAW2DXP2_9ROSI
MSDAMREDIDDGLRFQNFNCFCGLRASMRILDKRNENRYWLFQCCPKDSCGLFQWCIPLKTPLSYRIESHNASRQYGDWLRAYGSTKAAGDKTRSTSSDDGGERRYEDEDGLENSAHTTAHTSPASGKEGSLGSTGGGNISGVGRTGEKDGGSTGRTGAASSERKQAEETLRVGDYPTRAGCSDLGNSLAHADSFPPPTAPSKDLGPTKFNEAAFSPVGQKAQEENELMEVSSPTIKCESGPLTTSMGQSGGKKPKATVQLKKIAREKGKAKGLLSEMPQTPVGSKRPGKLIFEKDEEIPSSKKRCTEAGPVAVNKGGWWDSGGEMLIGGREVRRLGTAVGRSGGVKQGRLDGGGEVSTAERRC